MKLLARLAVLAALLLPLQAAQATSFDCTKAKQPSEKTICKDKNLSSLDELLAITFNKALTSATNKPALTTQQRAWLSERNLCAKDIPCLKAAYKARLTSLIALVANPEWTLTGKIKLYECGDNCYLTVRDAQGQDHTGLCTANLCTAWNEKATMPARYLNKRVKITVGTGVQMDAAENIMGEMAAFEVITLLN